MIFDAHCDIWTHVARKRLEGERDIMRNYHLNKFKESDINGGIFVVWVDPPYDKNPKYRTTQILSKIKEEIKDCDDIVHIVKKSEDFDIAKKSNKIAILIGMEGLQAIDDNIDDVEKLYSFGVRHASLTWNEENKLATGAKGNTDRGLTEDGAKLIKKMEELGMILDVSHTNEKTFWDICKVATKPFIASHSNCRSLCDVPRNITDDQLWEIAIRNGVVGVMGIDHIGLGFDFAEYLNADTLKHYASTYTYGVRGLEDTTKAKNIISVLEKRGYSKEDIEKICYKNFYRVIKEIIK